MFGHPFSPPADDTPAPTGELAEHVPGGVAGLYDAQGCALPQAVPEGCPLLTGGSLDESGWLAELIGVLNRELDAGLPVDQVVSTEVLVAVRALRSKHSIPDEQGIAQPENWIGPNVWAAVAAI